MSSWCAAARSASRIRRSAQTMAKDWFFTVSDAYPLYELMVEHVVLGERATADDWPPQYRSWRAG